MEIGRPTKDGFSTSGERESRGIGRDFVEGEDDKWVQGVFFYFLC